MQEAALLILAAAFGLLWLFIFGGVPLGLRRELLKARERAEKQFVEYKANSTDRGSALIGSTAQILDRAESYTSHNGQVHDYVLTLFLLSPDGQHFLFKSNEGGRPYVSALTPERARLVLKDKFRSTVAGDA